VRRCPRCAHPAASTDHYCLNCGEALPRLGGRWPWVLAGLAVCTCLIGAKVAGPVSVRPGPALLGASSAGVSAPPPRPTPAATCRFVLGFLALQTLIPARVGACRDNEHYDAGSGEAVQHTTGGLLVWRKADNSTAFTDGASTWVLGPHGVQRRPNTERFPWEANPNHLPVAAGT
jgi:hypothetical protein